MGAGIYIVTLTEAFLRPIDKDRRRPNCLRVNCKNIKVGKARDFDKRNRSYRGNFNPHYRFWRIAEIPGDLRLAERQVLIRFRECRIPHRSRLHEWLVGIRPAEGAERIIAALAEAGIDCSVHPDVEKLREAFRD